MKETNRDDINNFPPKKIIWGKWIILDPKMVHSHNSGSAGRIFLNFAQ